MASLIVSYVKYAKNTEYDVAEILGSTLGIIIFPMVLTYLIKGVNILFRGSFQRVLF